MTIHFQILGQPGWDNALFVRIDTGQAIWRLVFDCGEGCLAELGHSEVLAIETPGDSIAYLTDFRLNESNESQLAAAIAGCQVLVCESQYRHADLQLAERNDHTTTQLVAQLAQRAGVGQMVLFHLSDRYERTEWQEMLREAREIFPTNSFPAAWQIE